MKLLQLLRSSRWFHSHGTSMVTNGAMKLMEMAQEYTYGHHNSQKPPWNFKFSQIITNLFTHKKTFKTTPTVHIHLIPFHIKPHSVHDIFNETSHLHFSHFLFTPHWFTYFKMLAFYADMKQNFFCPGRWDERIIYNGIKLQHSIFEEDKNTF